MLTGAVSTALLWLAAGFADVPVVENRGAPAAVENIYYVQLDGMT